MFFLKKSQLLLFFQTRTEKKDFRLDIRKNFPSKLSTLRNSKRDKLSFEDDLTIVLPETGI